MLPPGTEVVLLYVPVESRPEGEGKPLLSIKGVVAGFRMRDNDIPLVLVNWYEKPNNTFPTPRAIHPAQIVVLDELDQEIFM
jgi:hypothetical protein